MPRWIGTSYCGRVLSGPRLRQVALVAHDWLRFMAARGGRGEGITEVTIAGLPGGGPWAIGGVRFAGEEG